ncbi:MAG: hypothetical protein IT372_10195 [Polyangiaceae bacterium]|nr:hypothetical protein [Polyangiaceae bacterium]
MRASFRSSFSLLSTAALVLGALALGCAPSPRDVPCSNDAQCEQANPAFKYCLQSRCVECVTASACGEGKTCDDGECKLAR